MTATLIQTNRNTLHGLAAGYAVQAIDKGTTFPKFISPNGIGGVFGVQESKLISGMVCEILDKASINHEVTVVGGFLHLISVPGHQELDSSVLQL